MAHAAQITTPTAYNVLTLLARPFVALGNGLIALAESNSRYQTLNNLMALSDAELAERGLKRDELVHRVYSDSYYL